MDALRLDSPILYTATNGLENPSRQGDQDLADCAACRGAAKAPDKALAAALSRQDSASGNNAAGSRVRSLRCGVRLSRGSHRVHDLLLENVTDLWKRALGRRRHGHPRPALRHEIVEGQGSGAGRLADHDAPDHAGHLMWRAVVVVDAFDA